MKTNLNLRIQSVDHGQHNSDPPLRFKPRSVYNLDKGSGLQFAGLRHPLRPRTKGHLWDSIRHIAIEPERSPTSSKPEVEFFPLWNPRIATSLWYHLLCVRVRKHELLQLNDQLTTWEKRKAHTEILRGLAYSPTYTEKKHNFPLVLLSDMMCSRSHLMSHTLH